MSISIPGGGGRLTLLVLTALLASVFCTAEAAAQVRQLRELDLSLSITADGHVVPTSPAFNRLVATVTSLPIDLVALEIGQAPILICATTSDRVYLTTRAGELVKNLPCFSDGSNIAPIDGSVLDGWTIRLTDGQSHYRFTPEQSAGLGDSRMTRLGRLVAADGSNVGANDVHLTILIDRNGNGRVDADEYSFIDVVVEQTNEIRTEEQPELTDADCRYLLRAEASRIDAAIETITAKYSTRLGSSFSVEHFSGDSTAVRETRGVFAILARDQFEELFRRVQATPTSYRLAARTEQPRLCTSRTEIRNTADVAIRTYEQLWEAALELADSTIRGWRKVYGKLGQ